MNTNLVDLYPELPETLETPSRPLELFEARRNQRGPLYHPRTRHLLPNGWARYTNRLFLETSPYLLQHAHNPVNWYPWGQEAFDEARRLNRPVLVSIGYATCHWCHVMEEESFEDEEIAAYLNHNFIAVKVDREERPDLDSVYMNALHATGAQGGWPLNMFLTSDRMPFYGGTYFPPQDHMRGIGFQSLLRRIKDAYARDPERVGLAGKQLTEAVRGMLSSTEVGAFPGKAPIANAVGSYRQIFDSINGGVTGAPKFPSSLPIRFLLRRYISGKGEDLLTMADLTLRNMARGGICDQVGGGFHRYSTDEVWLVPHFEKMLYDNALLAITYLEGYQATRNEEYATVVRETLQYLQRELEAPGGGFYSASDADSLAPSGDKEEGYFFTWTPEELNKLLGEQRAGVVASFYGITPLGNFEGRSIPHRKETLTELAKELGLAADGLHEVIQDARRELYHARLNRPLPLRDDKMLAAWNGLILSAFSRSGLILGNSTFLQQARKTAGFLTEYMVTEGGLAHSYQEGTAKGEGFLDDYACCIAGLLDLFEATGEVCWFEEAGRLMDIVQNEFANTQGGYFMTGSRHETLIAQEMPAYDGATPSGNSVMAMNLLRFHGITENPTYLKLAEGVFTMFSSRLNTAPISLAEMLIALDFYLSPSRQLIIVTPSGKPDAADGLMEQVRSVFIPNLLVLRVNEGENLERANTLIPLLVGKKADATKAVAYLCIDRACQVPTSDPEELGRQLREVTKYS